MLSISLTLPEGVAPPTMKGTLVGPPDDLRIEIRLADFVAALQKAKENGATVSMVPHGVEIDAAKPAPAFKPLKAERATKTAAKPATEAQQRWNRGQDPIPVAPAKDPAKPTIQDVILDHLKGGACTRVELLKAVCEKTGSTTETVDVTFSKCKQRGLVERFEDPNNGNLPKWRLPKGGQ